MKKKKGLIRILLLITVFAVCGVLYFKIFSKEMGTKVIAWDNVYNENNIKFFYEDNESIKKDNKLKSLDNTYSVNQLVSAEDTEIKKVLKTVEILNTIVKYDDVKDSLKYNGCDILKEKGTSKKTSGRDMAIIERDLLLTAGFIARTGEFRREKPQFENIPSYYVVEYWSNENNKWVMVDFLDAGYLESSNKPLSAIEVLSSDIRDLTYVGKSNQNDYRKKVKKYLNSYTIPIDSTILTTKSNCYVTYIKDSKYIDIMKNKNYIAPTIFTQNKDLFMVKPGTEIQGSDSKAYLILMKKPVSGKEDKLNFVVGGFKDGAVLDESYIKVNDGEFEKVDRYKEFSMQKGENTIKLSLDGDSIVSTIKIKSHK